MSYLCAVWHRSGEPRAQDGVGRLLDAARLRDPDRRGVWCDGPVALGHLLLATTPEDDHDAQPLVSSRSGAVLSADARIDNRDDLMRTLSVPGGAAEVPDAALVLAAYDRWGEECVDHLVGAFAFVVWDPREQRMLCVRDHLGARPLFVHESPELVVVSGQFGPLAELAGVSATPSREWLADFFMGSVYAAEATPFPSVRRLGPGRLLRVSGVTFGIRKYWAPEPRPELRLGEETAYADALAERTREAVRARLRGRGAVGAELSGGLDSSGLVGHAAPLLAREGRPLRTFTHVLPTEDRDRVFPFEDERAWAKKMTDFSGAESHLVDSSDGPGALGALLRSVDVLGLPCRGAGTFDDVLLEAVSAAGCRVLLSGFGGDEIVSSRGSGFHQTLLGRREWSRLWSELRATHRGRARAMRELLSLVLREWAPAAHGVLDRRGSRRARVASAPLVAGWPGRRGLADRYLAGARLSRGTVRERQASRLGRAGVAGRLEQAGVAGAARGVEYRHPLLDVRLVDFALSVPPELQVRDGRRRYLWRKSLDGLVPSELRWRADKSGATIPSGYGRVLRDRALIERRLADMSRDHCVREHLPWVDFEKLTDIASRLDERKAGLAPGQLGYLRRTLQIGRFLERLDG